MAARDGLTMAGPDPRQELAWLWASAALSPDALERFGTVPGGPVIPSSFPVAAVATTAIGAATLAAAELWRQRTGRAQTVTIDERHAAIGFRSERYLRIDGRPPGEGWNAIAGFYRAAGDRWLQLHTNFPHHLDAVTRVLGVPAERDAVAGAIAGWDADALDRAVTAAGGCISVLRTAAEWQSHPQGRAVTGMPLLTIDRIGDAPAEPAGTGDRPLSGVRVLDLTRVIAGPVCGRVLSAHGAEVLRVGAAHLPEVVSVLIDTGFGKRSTHLDLREPAGRSQLDWLGTRADVFVQSYRPGSLARRGFGPEDLARRRPGIVVVGLSAYGAAGPWAGRRGYDTLVQTACGIAEEEGRARGLERPAHVAAALLDHATGWLAAFGIMAVLSRRATEGGSYHVQVSLAQTAAWVQRLPRVDAIGIPDPRSDDVTDLLDQMASDWGSLTFVRPPGGLSETPPRWTSPPPRPGVDEAVWVDHV